MIKNPFQKFTKKETSSDETESTNDLMEEIRILSKRIGALETEVRLLKEQMRKDDERQEAESGLSDDNTSPKGAEHDEAADSPTTIYLPAPSSDGTFSEYSEEIQIGKSIYMLETETKERGMFSVIESKDAIATAIISTTQFLKPACKIASSTNGIPNHIITLEKGIAVFDGEKWKVEQKAIIKLDK